MRRHPLAVAPLAALLLASWSCGSGPSPAVGVEPEREPRRPNIVLIVADETPSPGGVVEALAAESVRVPRRAFARADPAVVGSSLLTGLSPDALGLEPPPSGRAPARLTGVLPADVTVFPEQLRRAGYYTIRRGAPGHRLGVSADEPSSDDEWGQPGLLGAWDAAGPAVGWAPPPEEPCAVAFGCRDYAPDPDAPFFALVNVTREAEVAHVLQELQGVETDPVEEETVVLYLPLAGDGPLLVRGREIAVRPLDDGVDVLDLAPTVLSLADAPVPAYLEGRVVLETGGQPPLSDPAGSGRVSRTQATPWVEGRPPPAATPGGYPTGGVFHVAPMVELWCDTEGASIIYATELVPPYRWRLYTQPFRMRFWKLRVRCGRLGHLDSPVVTYHFDIE